MSSIPPSDDVFIHPTSIVEGAVEIGPGTRVWHFCHIMPGAVIGAGCVLGQNVFIGGRARLGDSVHLQNNVSVYDGVVLEDDVFCGPSAVFTNVRTPRAHVSRKERFEPTRVCRGATIGANATVICGTTLGPYCFVGAGAVVTNDVAAHALVVGNPARQVGWVCRCGVTLEQREARYHCAECAAMYELREDALVESQDSDE
jgi:UDP-2-acetamido-3-amino-2,3-dideoxy-glucuronate N-acetyltransferase